MFQNCSLGGWKFAFPDVCLTPSPAGPVPIPYPNLAMDTMAVPPTASMKQLIMFMPSHNICTTIPTSIGDNAGVAGGVASGIIMGPARNIMGSKKVITNGTPATRWLDPTLQNSTNAPGGMSMVPNQFKVMVLT